LKKIGVGGLEIVEVDLNVKVPLNHYDVVLFLQLMQDEVVDESVDVKCLGERYLVHLIVVAVAEVVVEKRKPKKSKDNPKIETFFFKTNSDKTIQKR
jgi:hypothetical protein